MQELRRIEHDILGKGKVDSDHLEALRAALRAGGPAGRPEAEFLVGLRKRVAHPNPAFGRLVFQTLKDCVPADGRVGAGEAEWLRGVLLADGVVRDEERKFLRELRGESGHSSPVFEALIAEAMATPQERHTSR